LPCLQYFQACTSGTPPAGYIKSTVTPSSSVAYYLPWTQNSLNLKPYIGTNVTIRFTAAGCTPGQHFGYAYVDARCSPVRLLSVRVL
jgi:hypothetical protein